ncbi:hypothetical protein HMPREF1557_00122 [Streptococcus sobrinus W1703]|uniref:Uncharacterized protein n=1 Tax=Streptococcus sobrinus W1703 TaxID=1227275 RepID=U2KW10_9STRE|nr:hypothetical protein HMPREF1557_00122 [Streptococcus sobrinus W1703]
MLAPSFYYEQFVLLYLISLIFSMKSHPKVLLKGNFFNHLFD